jgi:hypothetical protein
MVPLDPKTMMVILWLIGRGYQVGTYAWCEDHASYDGYSGHQGGHAVDIDRLNGNYINSDSSGPDVIKVDQLLNNSVPTEIHPKQLISGGYGNHAVFQCSALTIPNAGFYGEKTMSEHCNHIHVGY